MQNKVKNDKNPDTNTKQMLILQNNWNANKCFDFKDDIREN